MMQAESSNGNPGAFEKWASDLACPACFGSLRLGETSVACTTCGRIYPIVDGIPVLIIERAEQQN
jgi:uncharacterized protein YbaR (Trm112 family)